MARPGLERGLTTVGRAASGGKALGGIALAAGQASRQGISGSPGGGAREGFACSCKILLNPAAAMAGTDDSGTFRQSLFSDSSSC